jgi:hypothetical protein
MSGITEKSQFLIRPRWKDFHIQQLPYFEGIWIRLSKEFQQSGIEISVYLE